MDHVDLLQRLILSDLNDLSHTDEDVDTYTTTII